MRWIFFEKNFIFFFESFTLFYSENNKFFSEMVFFFLEKFSCLNFKTSLGFPNPFFDLTFPNFPHNKVIFKFLMISFKTPLESQFSWVLLHHFPYFSSPTLWIPPMFGIDGKVFSRTISAG